MSNTLTDLDIKEFLTPYFDRYEQNSYSDDNYYNVPNVPACREQLGRVEKGYGVFYYRFNIPEKMFTDGGPEYIEVSSTYRIGD